MSSNKKDDKEEDLERSGPVFDPPVYIQRYLTVRDILYKIPGIIKVVDFGCAEGKFTKYLKNLPFVKEISIVDVLEPEIQRAAYVSRPLAWDYIFKRHEELVIKTYRGSVLENDARLLNYNAVTCIELIEHLQPEDHKPLVHNIFGFIRPKVAIFTTPNSEFNVLFPNFEGFRHWDHKFEWNRSEFKDWCESVLELYPDYTVEYQGVGDAPPESAHLGSVSQVAVFSLQPSAVMCEEVIPTSAKETYILVDENIYPGRSESEDIEAGSTGAVEL